MRIIDIHLDTIDSTNSYGLRHAASFLPDHITCISADKQTAGYGRSHDHWHSPGGVNLYLTYVFTLPTSIPDLPCLSHLMGYSLALILHRLSPQMKWPNDLLLQSKKLSGILTETIFAQNIVHIVLGIGINVNMPSDLLDKIDQPAISLLVATGHTWDRDALKKELDQSFLRNLETFKREGFAPFQHEINKLLAYRGEQVELSDHGQVWEGILVGVGKDGRIMLQLGNKEIHYSFSGSLKPLGKPFGK
jgi:BirA family biotin operon repressor/biotin-[acetyl-CoA-carboxylase] ligase